MRAPKPLQRLLRVRSLEEEHQRRSLESAMARLKTLEMAREAAFELEKQGLRRQTAGMISGSIADRQAGLVEAESAQRRARALAARIAATEDEVTARRQEYLGKRLERRQAETLVEEAAARDQVESGRRSQQEQDDWYGARARRTAAAEGE